MRALALVLVLAGLPFASARGPVIDHDWHLGPLGGSPAVLIESRKSLSGPRPEAPEVPALRLPAAPEGTVRRAAPARLLAAVPAPCFLSLPPGCTGPPRA